MELPTAVLLPLWALIMFEVSTADPCGSGLLTTRGECCSVCPPAYGVSVPCGNTNTKCELCKMNVTFSSTSSATERCMPCSRCPAHMEMATPCTPYEDTLCQCIPGYYLKVTAGVRHCLPCRTECSEEEVEVHDCTHVSDRTCVHVNLTRSLTPTGCVHCSLCPEHMEVLKACTCVKDTVCQCASGTYRHVEDGKVQCRPCQVCPRGHGARTPCSRLKDTQCEACTKGFYSEEKSSVSPCLPCRTDCDEGQVVLRECTTSSDMLCMGTWAKPKVVKSQGGDSTAVTMSTEVALPALPPLASSVTTHLAPRSSMSLTHSSSQKATPLVRSASESTSLLRYSSAQSARPLAGSAKQSVDVQAQPLVATDLNKSPPKRDSLKIQDLSRKKLTTIETQRVVAVLDEAIKSVELVSLFLYTAKNLERFRVVLGCDLMGAIREHKRLQECLLSVIYRIEEESRGEQPLSGEEIRVGILTFMVERGNGNFTLIQQAISSSVKNILRLFYTNHAASETLRLEDQARDASIQDLVQALCELRGFLFERLLTSPLEEKDKAHKLKELTQKNKKNAEIIKARETELAALIEDLDGETAKKNEVIRKLKNQLHQIEKISDEHIQRIKQEAEKQQKADLRASENNCLKLQQENHRQRNKLQSDIAEHREIEVALRKKKYKVETEIENWIQKYDVEMEEKQTELEEVQKVFEEEEAQLNELKEKMALLEEEYFQIVEERRVAQLKKEEDERELAILTRAATTIQAVWKGYLVRKMMKSKKKKGKKGKGKAKGKEEGKGKGKGEKGKKGKAKK